MHKIGDAVKEISTSGSGTTSWNGDRSDFVYSSNPVFIRGGYYYAGSAAGLFAFSNSGSGAYSNKGFRAVLIP